MIIRLPDLLYSGGLETCYLRRERRCFKAHGGTSREEVEKYKQIIQLKRKVDQLSLGCDL
ncbi:MAG: hypothetical protein MRK02_09265 [Candidatus Scalindua sp.]|nr:hypothetical protein [Candidatus Scalindua sp.]